MSPPSKITARLPPAAAQKGLVLTIGTFDGVHRGHQAIVQKTVRRARRRGLASAAITFSHPPRLFFFPKEGPGLITTLDEKIGLLKSLGLTYVDVLSFKRELAHRTAEEFFEKYLKKRYHARELVVGYNFGFGHDRRGDTRFLEKIGAENGIPVHVVKPVCLGDVPLSSEQIRRHLREGQFVQAVRKLGRPYRLSGRVVKGEGRGKTLGYPTANLAVPPEKILPQGVYAVRVGLPGGAVYGGMCNVGVRPTKKRPDPVPAVEAHLFGFSGRLAGAALDMEFVRKLREERPFSSWPELARQLRRDEKAARRALRK